MSAGPRLRSGVGWGAGGVSVVLAFLAIGLVAHALAPSPVGPALSSYATTPDGVAAWAELLQRAGHPVTRLRAPLAATNLNPDATLVVLGSSPLSSAEERRVRAFLSAGGRLVVGGPAVRTVRGLGFSSGVDALSDPSRVENRRLAYGDNAQHALQLGGSGGRPVVFDESIHGFAQASGLAAFPTRWWVGIAGLALAATAWALARGRRLGGPDPLPAPAPSPRSEYLDAMAATLDRTDHDEVAKLARARGRRSDGKLDS